MLNFFAFKSWKEWYTQAACIKLLYSKKSLNIVATASLIERIVYYPFIADLRSYSTLKSPRDKSRRFVTELQVTRVLSQQKSQRVLFGMRTLDEIGP